MLRSIRWASALSALVLALAWATPASAQLTYQQGETVSITVGQLPSAYTTYWVSDRDGYLDYGNTIVTNSLSVGPHRLYALIYRNADQAHVWTGSIDFEILQATPSTPTTPTTNPGSTPYAPGEFEPVKELLLGTEDVYGIEDLYIAMIGGIQGSIPTTIYADNDYVRYDLQDMLRQAGLSSAPVTIRVTPIDSIWMRDYGPLFVKNGGGALEVCDLEYYPNRPNDNRIPQRFAQDRGLRVRPVNHYWEGGNFTADGRGGLFATDVLYTRNNASNSTIKRNVETAFEGGLTILDHMLDDGGTGHLDMFFLMTSQSSVLLNKFPSSHRNYQRMENHAQTLAGMGYSVTRLSTADNRFSSHTNGLLINGRAFVPTYANSTTDQAAIRAYQNAGYQAIPVDCRRIIQWSGAIHCITITVPQ